MTKEQKQSAINDLEREINMKWFLHYRYFRIRCNGKSALRRQCHAKEVKLVSLRTHCLKKQWKM